MDDTQPRVVHSQTLRVAEVVLLVAAAVVALASARNYAGGWNDGSRLATVESLVDRHTLAIDDSIFVRSGAAAIETNPYTPGDERLQALGTQDKLLIDGHYYSDKSPLAAFWLAACYQLCQWLTGLTAREHPRIFCYLMTIASSGLAYVVTVWSSWRLALRKGLPLGAALLCAASIALATSAPVYARHVNNHLPLLAVVSLLMLALDRLADARDLLTATNPKRERGAPAVIPRLRVGLVSAIAGALAGVAYTCDLGVGPVLLLTTTALVAYRTRSVLALGCYALGVLPWLAAHHAVNYSIGGTWGPANSVAAYLAWPGSPFNVQNMTGGWAHHNLGHFVLYAAALLFGKQGFVTFNLPLWLAVAGSVVLCRRRLVERPELAFSAAFCGGTWLLYAALSNNYSGPCCSIRWFVPLLAPGYYALVLLLRERPELARQLAILTCLGAVLCGFLWWRGPWKGDVPILLWPLNALALIGLYITRAAPAQTQPVKHPRRQAA